MISSRASGSFAAPEVPLTVTVIHDYFCNRGFLAASERGQVLSGSVVVRCPLRNCGINQSTNIIPRQVLSGSVVVRCPLRNCGINQSTNIIPRQVLSGSVVVRCPLRNCGIRHSTNIRPLQALSGSEPFLTQKDDLIAELKMSKDISGIKKLKVERAKVEERQEKEMFTEITKQLNANTFVEKIPDKDATGNPIPPWKRQMLAKKAAERAKKELEEQLLKEAEEKRLQSIPPWKRQLLAKKEEIDTRKPVIYTPRVIDDKKPTKVNKGEESLKPPQIVDPSPSPPPTENEEDDNNNSVYNKENKTPPSEESAEGPAQIIPWRAQLRKTNSKLSLLE
uniref:(California timema) hypothetical protein n=1 Tax=Timema californicum TaxID=61474 RepID=A0A7R9P4P9_TIMCA|nr:unnamed protein product [Timema californicum]